MEERKFQVGDRLVGESVAENAVSPAHYRFGDAQVIDIIRHLDFLSGSAIKYLARAGRKGDRLTDLKKARQFVDWLIADAEKENQNGSNA